jgi:hypothetical protein
VLDYRAKSSASRKAIFRAERGGCDLKRFGGDCGKRMGTEKLVAPSLSDIIGTKIIAQFEKDD